MAAGFSLLKESQISETLLLEEMISCLTAGDFTPTANHVFQTLFPLLQCVQNMVETLFVHLEVLCVHIEPS